MPRPKTAPRLWLDKARQTWTIIDGRKSERTGFGKAELQGATDALRDYLAYVHVVTASGNPLIADVLKAYAAEVLTDRVSGWSISYDLDRLELWWGEKRASDITADNCRKYIEYRNAPQITRRELGFLKAAYNHWNAEHGPLTVIPVIVKPKKSDGKKDWLTRHDAAVMLWAGRRKKNFVRYFLIGWYTGSRPTTICRTRWDMVDFETGIMQRRLPDVQETRKRTPPVKAGPRLLAHLRRWKRADGADAEFILSFVGKALDSIDSQWNEVKAIAKLPKATPHIMRHSRATHLMRQAVDPWQAAQSLGMSVELLQSTYGHHHPDWQSDAAAAK